jgi:hypothetical protein
VRAGVVGYRGKEDEPERGDARHGPAVRRNPAVSCVTLAAGVNREEGEWRTFP